MGSEGGIPWDPTGRRDPSCSVGGSSGIPKLTLRHIIVKDGDGGGIPVLKRAFFVFSSFSCAHMQSKRDFSAKM